MWLPCAGSVCVCLRADGFDKIPTFPTISPKVVLLLFLTRGCLIVFVVLSIPTFIVVCATATILRGFRSLSATDDILTGSRMVRLTAQQRAELVQLHLQGESIDAIVQRTGHARTTVLRWVRRFAVDGLLLDRPRSGRPLSVMTPTVVGRIRQLAKAKRGRRSRSTRQIAAVLSSRGTLISRTSMCQALHSKGVKPYVQPQVLCSGMVTSSDDCASRLSRRNVIGDAVCLLMRRHLCVILAPIVATTSSGLMTPAPSNPSCVLPTLSPSTPSGAFSASGKSPLFFFSENLTAPLYVSILESTVLPAARDWFSSGHWAYLQDSDPKHTAKLTQDWLRDNVPEYITREQWPPRSPDLNPIENAWALLGEASLAAPTKNARGVETCSAWGVDGGDDRGVLYHSG